MESAEALISHHGKSEKKKNGQKKNNNSIHKHDKLRDHSIGHNQCVFSLEMGHWKKDYPKLKEKIKRGSSEAKANLI